MAGSRASPSKAPYTAADVSLDPRALDGMSPAQEIANAVSMLAPSLVALSCWLDPPPWLVRGPHTAGILVALVLHLPFSMTYHVCLARRVLPDAVENLPRKLDQGFVHVSCMLLTWSLSDSSLYAALCTLANAQFLFRLWFRNPGVLERMANIGLGTFMYGFGGLLRGDFEEWLCGASWFLVGAVAMLLRLRGWGHSIMHVCLGGLAYYCLQSASKLQALEFGLPAGAGAGMKEEW